MKPTLKDVKNLKFVMRPSDRGQIVEVNDDQAPPAGWDDLE